MLADNKIYTLSHVSGGFLLPPEVRGSVSKVVDIIRYELAKIDGFEMSDDVAQAMRRNIAHSFKPHAKPFTMVVTDKDDKRHVFRVDKHKLKIGVN